MNSPAKRILNFPAPASAPVAPGMSPATIDALSRLRFHAGEAFRAGRISATFLADLHDLCDRREAAITRKRVSTFDLWMTSQAGAR